MKTTLSGLWGGLLLRVVFPLATVAPWLLWLDLNVMALRFVCLRGKWPMCPTVLPCRPTCWAVSDVVDTLHDDPVYLLVGPKPWHDWFVFWSASVWLLLWFTAARRLPVSARRSLLFAFLLGWASLVLDPTRAVRWYTD